MSGSRDGFAQVETEYSGYVFLDGLAAQVEDAEKVPLAWMDSLREKVGRRTDSFVTDPETGNERPVCKRCGYAHQRRVDPVKGKPSIASDAIPNWQYRYRRRTATAHRKQKALPQGQGAIAYSDYVFLDGLTSYVKDAEKVPLAWMDSLREKVGRRTDSFVTDPETGNERPVCERWRFFKKRIIYLRTSQSSTADNAIPDSTRLPLVPVFNATGDTMGDVSAVPSSATLSVVDMENLAQAGAGNESAVSGLSEQQETNYPSLEMFNFRVVDASPAPTLRTVNTMETEPSIMGVLDVRNPELATRAAELRQRFAMLAGPDGIVRADNAHDPQNACAATTTAVPFAVSTMPLSAPQFSIAPPAPQYNATRVYSVHDAVPPVTVSAAVPFYPASQPGNVMNAGYAGNTFLTYHNSSGLPDQVVGVAALATGDARRVPSIPNMPVVRFATAPALNPAITQNFSSVPVSPASTVHSGVRRNFWQISGGPSLPSVADLPLAPVDCASVVSVPASPLLSRATSPVSYTPGFFAQPVNGLLFDDLSKGQDETHSRGRITSPGEGRGAKRRRWQYS